MILHSMNMWQVHIKKVLRLFHAAGLLSLRRYRVCKGLDLHAGSGSCHILTPACLRRGYNRGVVGLTVRREGLLPSPSNMPTRYEEGR